jgi:DNA polymerase-3 subunit epsilon
MNFTAIDFETANALDPCEIGLTKVENGKIVETKSWLIKPACFPYMNRYHEMVHGISSNDLQREPHFEHIWGEIKPFIEDELIVAHNAGFDMNVLRFILAYYDLAIPCIEYFCSVSLSRKVWKNLPNKYSLGALCDEFNIRFNHHRAGDDARACAQIVLKAIEETQMTDLHCGLNNLGVKINRLKHNNG